MNDSAHDSIAGIMKPSPTIEMPVFESLREIHETCPRCANKDIRNGRCTTCKFKVYFHV